MSARNIASFLKHLGVEEPDHIGVEDTPKRVARMYREELLSSYQPGAMEKLLASMTTFPAAGKHEMVIEHPIPFISLCAHHMLPFVGEASVGYIPDKLVVGLSKIPRVVDFFSRKLQMQERLTSEVADFLMEYLKPKGVIVRMKARHLCMEARGVRKAGVATTTSALRGICTEAEVKSEFFTLLSL